MKKSFFLLKYFFLLAILIFPAFSQAQSSDYKSPEQVSSWIKQVENEFPELVSTHNIARSPGERPILLIRIGKSAENEKPALPSVFVAANLEGNRPLSTEGAIFLAESILSDPEEVDQEI